MAAEPEAAPTEPSTQRSAPAAAQRRLALLWEPALVSSRGRRPRYTLADIVRAGIEVADEVGLAQLSMRRVAQRLGAGTMSLYTYVESREELLELMIDRVHGELDLPTRGTPWRPALRQHALEHWAMYRRHPWLLDVNMWRGPLGPHVLDAEEAGYRTLIDTGLSPREVVEVIGAVNGFIQGLARAANAEAREERVSGISAEEYWTSSSFWSTYFDPERYPTMTRIWNAGGFEATGDVTAGLDRLLDAIELTIAHRAAER